MAAVRLCLLDGLALCLDQRTIRLGMDSGRVLALLALHQQPQSRSYVAGTLWGEHDESRSFSNLRTALARLPRPAGCLVQAIGPQLGLSARVWVDIRDTSDLIQKIIERNQRFLRLPGVHRRLMRDLLPGWREDWVVGEQECYRQLRLHALEILCDAFTADRNFAAAVEAGAEAVASDPLRESARRALIRAHLAQGNRVTAIAQYRRYCLLLERKLGLEPSQSLAALIPHQCRNAPSPVPVPEWSGRSSPFASADATSALPAVGRRGRTAETFHE